MVTLRGRAAGDKALVLLQESKRNVCEHALQSTEPCTTVRVNATISVAGQGKKIVQHKFTASTLPTLTISLTLAINQSVIFVIYIDIKSLRTRPDCFFFMYPTSVASIMPEEKKNYRRFFMSGQQKAEVLKRQDSFIFTLCPVVPFKKKWRRAGHSLYLLFPSLPLIIHWDFKNIMWKTGGPGLFSNKFIHPFTPLFIQSTNNYYISISVMINIGIWRLLFIY